MRGLCWKISSFEAGRGEGQRSKQAVNEKNLCEWLHMKWEVSKAAAVRPGMVFQGWD